MRRRSNDRGPLFGKETIEYRRGRLLGYAFGPSDIGFDSDPKKGMVAAEILFIRKLTHIVLKIPRISTNKWTEFFSHNH